MQVILNLINLDAGSYQIEPIVLQPEGIAVKSIVPPKIQVEITVRPGAEPTATPTQAAPTATFTPRAHVSCSGVNVRCHPESSLLVGRPNVGKSTLFNRLVGRQEAIVEDIPGTTRDRLYAEAEWNDRHFIIVDTGGMEIGAEADQRPAVSVASEPYVSQIRSQAEIAIEEADVVVMVADARDGMTSADDDIAEVLRRSQKPVILAINKADNDIRAESVYEFYQLGLGMPYAISALHGLGVGDLLDEIVRGLPADEADGSPPAPCIWPWSAGPT